MRRPLRPPRPQGRSLTAVWPAPIKGLKTDEGLTKELPGAALILKNIVPETDAVRVRRGYQQYAYNFNVMPVKTLMPYISGTASKHFACAQTEIWDVTTAGDKGAGAAVRTGQTQSYRSYANFTASGGTHYLITVNGADTGSIYDGTSWAAHAATGPTLASLIYVWSFKSRLWFIKKTSMSAYYGGVGAIAGVLTEFPLGAIFRRGGHLIAGAAWSVDSSVGLGQDDMIAFVSSEGEVAVYEMSDPDDPGSLLLKGVYFVGRPLGQRCLAQYGGDLLILTYSGLVALSKVVNIDRGVEDYAAITAPVRTDFAADALAYGANTGWEVVIYPAVNLGIINVPVSDGVEYKQYVWNLLTGAFATWTNLPSECFSVYLENLYFGGISEVVYQAEYGSADDTASIVARICTTYSQLGSPGRGKQVHLARPIIESNQAVVGGVAVLTNYEDPGTAPSNASTSAALTGFTWGVSNWGQAYWPGTTILRDWQGAADYANSIAIDVGITISSTVPSTNLTYRIIGYDLLYEVGGILGG